MEAMASSAFVHALILSVFPFLLVFAAVSDMVTMTISNRISILLTIGFVVLAFLLSVPLVTIAAHFGAAFLILAFGFVFFACGWIGGGDAKLAAAISLWFGFDHTLQFAFISAVFGGGLTLAVIMARDAHLPIMFHRWPWLERILSGSNGVPYGIALSAAALVIYPQTFWIAALV